MKKKLLSLLLVIAVMMTSVSMGFGSLIAAAVPAGGGIEAINAFSLVQNGDATGTSFNTSITIKSKVSGYQIKVNSITATIRYYQDETSALTTAYVDANAQGVVCDKSGKTFGVTGSIAAGLAGLIRYECNYNLLDNGGNVIYEGMTGYGFGAVSANGQQTGALGTYSPEPPRPGDRYYFGSFGAINSLYVQTPSIVLTSNQETSSNAIAGTGSVDKSFALEGAYPNTITLRTLHWDYVEMYGSGDVTTTWFEMNSMPNGYFNFKLKYDGNDFHNVEMYYRNDAQKNAALNLYDQYIDKSLEKSYYTADTWNYYLYILELTALVGMAIPGPNYAFRLACQYADAAAAGDFIKDAETALDPRVSADYTVLTTAYNEFSAVKNNTVDVKTYEASYTIDGGTFGNTTIRLYTQAAVDAVENKYKGYDRNLYRFDQLIVNGYVSELRSLTANLAYSDAVYTYLNVALQEYETFKQNHERDNLYSNVTWDSYKNAAEAAKGLSTSLKTDSQGEINKCLSALVDAKKALKYGPADIRALQVQIGISEDIFAEYDKGQLFVNAEGFDEVWDYLNDFYNQAKAATNYTKDKQDEVDEITRSLDIINKELEKYRALDTTELQNVLKLTPEHEESKYVAASYSTWSSLRVEGYMFLAKTYLTYTGEDRKSYADREEMNRLIELIQSAYDNLEKVKADFTELDGYVAQIPSDEVLALYKQEYVDAIEAVVKTIDYGATFDQQDEVDQVAENLKNALAALVYENYKDADYSGVEDAIADANAYNRADYANFEIVDKAIAAVEYGKKIVEQNEVDAMEKAIRDAIAKLGFIPADYSEVETLIEEVENYPNKDWYANFGRVQIVIDSIDWELTLDKQDQVDAYADAIREALSELRLAEADYTEVNNAIKAARDIEPLSDFEKDFVDALDTAIADVEAGLTKDRQAEVDAMAEAIYAVLATSDDHLKLADYTRLNAAITFAETHDTGEYENYDEVILPVIAKENIDWNLKCRDTADKQHLKIMQDQIDAIYGAVNQLKLKGADYSKVEAAITDARNFYNEGKDGKYPYSQDSIRVVENVIQGINWEYNIREQSYVDAYITAIEQALEKLELARADYSEIDEAKAEYNVLKAKQDEEGTYTAESFKPLQEYVEKVDMSITIDRQDEIAPIAAEIRKLIGELKFSPADYTRIENAKADFNGIIKNNRDYYFDEDIDAVQSALDAVEYGLSKEHQAEVNEKADAIESALNHLKGNMRPAELDALYAARDAANAKYEEMTNSDYTLDMSTWELVQNLLYDVDLYDNNTKINEQDAINALTAEIIAATAKMAYKFQIIWEGSGLISEGSGKAGSNSYIYGFEEGAMSSDAEALIKFVGEAELRIRETINGFGTGTVIEFVSTKDGSILAQYTVLVFGDANGDAVIDTFDVAYIAEVVNSGEEPDDVILKVLDLVNDGYIDAMDVSVMISLANMDATLKQNGTMETY